jgi:protein-tyrosine phosphatase
MPKNEVGESLNADPSLHAQRVALQTDRPPQTPGTLTPQVRPGFINVHSHLLYAIDDGCQNLNESLACVRALIERGFAGTICTPHVWPDAFPLNRPANIARWVDRLRDELRLASLDYPIWTGGEVRLTPDIVNWMQEHGVPTLGPSNYVLTDYWGYEWEYFINASLRWLVDHGYRPIFAHPERLNPRDEFDARLQPLEEMGVLLQGNFRSATGEEGPSAAARFRKLMNQGRYQLLALDMHGPESLSGRFRGLLQTTAEYGEPRIRDLTERLPRELLGLATP